MGDYTLCPGYAFELGTPLQLGCIIQLLILVNDLDFALCVVQAHVMTMFTELAKYEHKVS